MNRRMPAEVCLEIELGTGWHRQFDCPPMRSHATVPGERRELDLNIATMRVDAQWPTETAHMSGCTMRFQIERGLQIGDFSLGPVVANGEARRARHPNGISHFRVAAAV